jgi:hypothetical protein
MTIEQAIEHAEDIAISAIGCECREEHRQLAAWLRELQERRKEPEIVRCGECELKLVCCRTIRSDGRRADDFCSCGIRAERRTE